MRDMLRDLPANRRDKADSVPAHPALAVPAGVGAQQDLEVGLERGRAAVPVL